MTIDEMIEVLTAAKEGKAIESRTVIDDDESDTWHLNIEPKWNFQVTEYRVKPEPRRFWIIVGSYPVIACATRHECESLYPRQNVIEVVEVLK